MDIQEEMVMIIEQDKKESFKNDQTRIDGTINTIAKEIVDASLKPEIDDFNLNIIRNQ